MRIEVQADSDQQGNTVALDPFDTTMLGNGIPNYVLDPSFAKNMPPLVTEEQEGLLKGLQEKLDAKTEADKLAAETPAPVNFTTTVTHNVFYEGDGIDKGFDKEAAWIQTYSGRRFNPTNPYPDAIVIQDIAHALSMQCRFSGHTKKFYSVAQHSVLVSYICDSRDALWGLMHDASEAYLVDVPRPLKQSGKFDTYLEFEAKMQNAICKRFGLPMQEPPSVKMADTKLLATEARDLMSPLHADWVQRTDPLPFIIEPWGPDKAKDMFMKRFFELTCGDSAAHHYQHYLQHKDQL
jgi:hypothetical protein